MAQLFDYPEDYYIYGTINGEIIYQINDKNYRGNHEIFYCQNKMWIVNKITSKCFRFLNIDIEMARQLREKFDKNDVM